MYTCSREAPSNRIIASPAALEEQGSTTYTPVQVINLEVKDNHEEATLGAFLILQLCEMVSIPHTDSSKNILHPILMCYNRKRGSLRTPRAA